MSNLVKAILLLGLGYLVGNNADREYEVAREQSEHIQRAEQLIQVELPKHLSDSTLHTVTEFDTAYALLLQVEDHLQKAKTKFPDQKLRGLLAQMSTLHNGLDHLRPSMVPLTETADLIRGFSGEVVNEDSVRQVIFSAQRSDLLNNIRDTNYLIRTQIIAPLESMAAKEWKSEFLEYEEFKKYADDVHTIALYMQQNHKLMPQMNGLIVANETQLFGVHALLEELANYVK